MTKIAYLHNLPLEYYPPACNFLNLAGQLEAIEIRAYTTANRKGRTPYANSRIRVERSQPPNPEERGVLRLLRAAGWHMKTALSLVRFKPDALVYVEPHSAIAAWLYFQLFGGKGRLFIHHHEYYEPVDYRRRGMRLPGLGSRFERNGLFRRAEWISQTNEDRLRLARRDHPDISAETWRVLPNYPPLHWTASGTSRNDRKSDAPLRLIYVGSASFADTYIEEITRWAAAHPGTIELHICGYNVSAEVWEWLERERFGNVTYHRDGFGYDDLPNLLREFTIGLVLYKGNTTNFVFNVPNKVFEYLRCGLAVWYPREMKGITNFRSGLNLPLEDIDFNSLSELTLEDFHTNAGRTDVLRFTAERAFAPLLERLVPGGACA